VNESVRQTLCRIVTDYGREITEDYQRCEALLRDLCAPHRREVSVLARALPERVADDLLTWQDSLPREVIMRRLANRLENNLALTEPAARWAVETWALALLAEARATPPAPWHEFRSAGAQELRGVELEAGLAILEGDYQGEGNFIVELYDGAGSYVELLSNRIGPGRSSKPVRVAAAGSYTLNVLAAGAWEIDVRQPRFSPIQTRERPATFVGSGQQATPFVHLGVGETVVEATHSGEGNFTAVLLTEGGAYVELLCNEVGACRAAKNITVRAAGLYLLDVMGDGDWVITVG
jgi:hypothetical protein